MYGSFTFAETTGNQQNQISASLCILLTFLIQLLTVFASSTFSCKKCFAMTLSSSSLQAFAFAGTLKHFLYFFNTDMSRGPKLTGMESGIDCMARRLLSVVTALGFEGAATGGKSSSSSIKASAMNVFRRFSLNFIFSNLGLAPIVTSASAPSSSGIGAGTGLITGSSVTGLKREEFAAHADSSYESVNLESSCCCWLPPSGTAASEIWIEICDTSS
jgi:hypothetical protein